MTLIFNRYMQSPTALPGFWIFMYRVSPLTNRIGGMANAMLYGRPSECSTIETSVFDPPADGEIYGSYLAPYLSEAPGALQNPTATAGWRYYQLRGADRFLASINISCPDRRMDSELIWLYVAFNVADAIFLYRFFRARKSSGKKSVGLLARTGAVVEAIHNSYKARARANRKNVEVW